MPILADYHMHTPLCKHATGPMEDYIERAIELGFEEVGFSDHSPLPGGLSAHVRMEEAELDYYVNEVLRLRAEYYGKIDVKLGLEVDYLEGLEAYCEKIIARYPWDYIIGSVHFLDSDCRMSSWPKHYAGDIAELYARYFGQVRKLARAGLCDIIGHFDLPKRTGQLPPERNADDIAGALEAIARAGLCLEINTSGYRHPELPVPEPYPSLAVVEQALRLGIPLTVNSDAHDPKQVGMGFAQIELWLAQNGCRQLARFESRERARYDL
jgi:histidinol-phosphatase (PHP family)